MHLLVVLGEDEVAPTLELLLPVPEHGGGAHDKEHADGVPLPLAAATATVVVARTEPDPAARNSNFFSKTSLVLRDRT